MAAFTTNAHTHHTPRPSFFERFDAFFTDLGRARTCAQDYQRLSMLSDAQLAARGLQRSDLVRHVARAYL